MKFIIHIIIIVYKGRLDVGHHQDIQFWMRLSDIFYREKLDQNLVVLISKKLPGPKNIGMKIKGLNKTFIQR